MRCVYRQAMGGKKPTKETARTYGFGRYSITRCRRLINFFCFSFLFFTSRYFFFPLYSSVLSAKLSLQLSWPRDEAVGYRRSTPGGVTGLRREPYLRRGPTFLAFSIPSATGFAGKITREEIIDESAGQNARKAKNYYFFSKFQFHAVIDWNCIWKKNY